MSYTNLINVKSFYNFLNSNIKIEEYVYFAKKNGLDAVFYADDNYMYGAANFVEIANKNNIKPIIGVNVFISEIAITVYAKNYEGYKSICHITSLFDMKDKMNEENIIEQFINLINNNLVIIFSPCNKSNLSLYEEIKNKIDLIYIGVNLKNKNLIKDYFNNENKIFSEPIRNLYSDETNVLNILEAIKENKLIENIKNNNNYFFDNNIIDSFVNINEHDDNINKIISECNFNLFENNKKHFLKYVNKDNADSKKYIEKVCENNLERYLTKKNMNDSNRVKYFDRLYKELDVINKMNFNDYFLIVADMISFAREKNILVGPGRGSAPASIVSFLLKISKLDPIEFDLIFERFLNIERQTLPDIDIDFQDDRRDEIIEYLFEKYGPNHFATIVTFQTIGIKNAIRDCGKALSIPSSDISEMTKSIRENNTFDLELAIKNSKVLEKYFYKYSELYYFVKKIIGLPRQTGTHAAGVIFCDEKIQNIIPTKIGINGINQSQFPMTHLEDLGLIKTDILGLKNLTIIQEILTSINKSRGKNINLDEITLEDKQTYELLQQGDTSGIFQLESQGMTEVLIKLKPNNIFDIANTSSLYRPGPQENIPEFIRRKNSNIKDFNVIESLKDILMDTYGIIVYQEQVIKILQVIANMSLSKSDIVRRAMGKKDSQLMEKIKSEFIDGAIKNKYNKNTAIEIWNYVYKFASYGFNKSHAISYSLIGYWLAYLKTHYTPEFYCALLNGNIRNEEKCLTYIREIRAKKINLDKPTIKNPNSIYFWRNNAIQIPLSAIKFIGPEFYKNLRQIYLDDKTIFDNLFSILTSLYQKGINDQTYIALVYSGAFDIYGFSRQQLINNKEKIFRFLQINSRSKSITKGQNVLIEKEVNNLDDIIQYEKEYLGFYISAHPLVLMRSKLNVNNILNLSNLKKENIIATVLVIVDYIRTKLDKNSKEMAFVEVSDETGQTIITMFSSQYANLKNKINVGDILLLKIKTELFNNKISTKLNEFIKKIK